MSKKGFGTIVRQHCGVKWRNERISLGTIHVLQIHSAIEKCFILQIGISYSGCAKGRMTLPVESVLERKLDVCGRDNSHRHCVPLVLEEAQYENRPRKLPH
jgi:hypothetical protein